MGFEDAAREHGRRLNAEVTARLQDSFDGMKLLPHSVQMAVADMAEELGVPAMAALEKLVLAGQSKGGKVLNIKVAHGTTPEAVRDAISAALELAPDADLVMEREPQR